MRLADITSRVYRCAVGQTAPWEVFWEVTLEVDPSLCVFRKIWAAEGRAFEMIAGDVNPGKSFFINELFAYMQYWTEGAH